MTWLRVARCVGCRLWVWVGMGRGWWKPLISLGPHGPSPRPGGECEACLGSWSGHGPRRDVGRPRLGPRRAAQPRAPHAVVGHPSAGAVPARSERGTRNAKPGGGPRSDHPLPGTRSASARPSRRPVEAQSMRRAIERWSRPSGRRGYASAESPPPSGPARAQPAGPPPRRRRPWPPPASPALPAPPRTRHVLTAGARRRGDHVVLEGDA